MTYEYRCSPCDHTFDVIKPAADMEVNENCPQCGEFAVRQFVPKKVFFSGTKVTHAEYNPGLGQVVMNKRHKQDLMKRKNMVEVGNDFKSGDSLQKTFDAERKEKIAKRYEDA